MSDILLAEYTLKRALREHTMDLIQTSSPHLFCTPLPKHWRSNKSLPNQFRVVSLINIPDGTRVSVSAGNEDRPFAELKNPITVMHGNEARFSDLRFLGRSGRGKSFNITITIETSPPLVAVYARAIKVTVDGPRVPRNKYSTPRTMKIMKEHRRLGTRHGGSFEQNRYCRGSMARGISYLNDSVRTAMKRNSAASTAATNTMKESFQNYKAQSNGRAPLPSSAFRLTAPPCSPANPLRRPGSPVDTSESLPTLSTLSNGCSMHEKSPSSSDHSVPSFSTKPETAVPFSPFESTYLLSSINEAYARLLSRHFHSRPPPPPALSQQPVNSSGSAAINRPFPSSSLNSDLGPTNLSITNEAHLSRERRTSSAASSSVKDDNGWRPADQFRNNGALSRQVPPVLSDLFTQSRLMSQATGNVLPQSNFRPATESTPMMTVSNGNRPGQLNGPDDRTQPLGSNLFAYPLSSLSSTFSANLNQTSSGLQTSSMTLMPGPATSTLNPYESSFYGILGAMFASWIQRSTDRKGMASRPVGPSPYVPVPFGSGACTDRTPESDTAMDTTHPIDLAARAEQTIKWTAEHTGKPKAVDSTESIMSIERLLEHHSSSRMKEHERSDEKPGFCQIPNPFRYPTHPFNVSDLTLLSNAFTKHLKDQSFRT